MRQLPSREKFLGDGKGVGAGAGEPLKHELSMEPERKYYNSIILNYVSTQCSSSCQHKIKVLLKRHV